jgi:hypothetical protein
MREPMTTRARRSPRLRVAREAVDMAWFLLVW